MEEEWVGEAAEALERITRDPMADAHRGCVRVLSVSDPSPRGAYQTCAMQLELDAPGVVAETVEYEAVFPRRHWPTPGQMRRARISRSVPRVVEVEWETAIQ